MSLKTQARRGVYASRFPHRPSYGMNLKRDQSNAVFLDRTRQPQPGILPPPLSLSGFVIIRLRPDFDAEVVGNALSAIPSAGNPPYVPSNDTDDNYIVALNNSLWVDNLHSDYIYLQSDGVNVTISDVYGEIATAILSDRTEKESIISAKFKDSEELGGTVTNRTGKVLNDNTLIQWDPIETDEETKEGGIPYGAQVGSFTRAPPVESSVTDADRISNTFGPSQLQLNIGFSPDRWKQLYSSGPQPKNMQEMVEWTGVDLYNNVHTMPATGGDILLHVKSSQQDLINEVIDGSYELLESQLLRDETGAIDSAAWEVDKAFGSVDGRNQFGYFDASSDAAVTANPTLDVGNIVNAYPKGVPDGREPYYQDIGRFATTFIGDEDENNRMGSFAITQKYIHSGIERFKELKEDDQDRVFGRTKSGAFWSNSGDPLGGGLNAELPHAHIVRTHIREIGNGVPDPVQQPNGETGEVASEVPLQIYRQAGSFQNEAGEKGLYFMAYCRYASTFNDMLSRMIGKTVTVPGDQHVVDTLLYYTKAMTGQLWFFPNVQQLASLASFPVKPMPVVAPQGGSVVPPPYVPPIPWPPPK